MHVPISKIKIDGGTQPRCDIDEGLVSEYADAMTAGDAFPPIVVFHDGVSYWLADGFHRVHAARRIGRADIDAEVHNGTRRDAVLHSVGANSAHGKRRIKEDAIDAYLSACGVPALIKYDSGEWGRTSAFLDHAVKEILDDES